MDNKLENFEEAFRDRMTGAVRECECGRVFYNSDGGWDFEEGELESLEKNSNATDLDYSVGTLTFDGTPYCLDCSCWQSKAQKFILWLNGHRSEIAEYFKLEKSRHQGEADSTPVIG